MNGWGREKGKDWARSYKLYGTLNWVMNKKQGSQLWTECEWILSKWKVRLTTETNAEGKQGKLLKVWHGWQDRACWGQTGNDSRSSKRASSEMAPKAKNLPPLSSRKLGAPSKQGHCTHMLPCEVRSCPHFRPMVTWSISMIFSLVSMTMMSSFSGSACFTLPSGAVAVGVMGRKPPPRSTTWVISSPTPWMDRITLLPRKGQDRPRSQQIPGAHLARGRGSLGQVFAHVCVPVHSMTLGTCWVNPYQKCRA